MSFRTRHGRAVMRNDSTGQFRGSVGRRRRGSDTALITSQLVVDNRELSRETREELERIFAGERHQSTPEEPR